MAGPSKVEFPGQKRQRLRMRGTKRAGKNVQQRLRKNLDVLIESPESVLPELRWKGKLAWGRTDPVTKTLKEISKVLDKRHHIHWLNKRMMGKRGDPIAKAWAGALAAAHDDDISLVGTFNHPIYGNSSYVRKGDSKPIFSVGVQNHRNIKIRLLPWENHARRGWWFFSWSGGFVCSGNTPTIPEGWLEEVIESLGVEVQNDGDEYLVGDVSEGGISLDYTNGKRVVIGPDILSEERKNSLIAEMALTMLPPKLTGVAEGGFTWRPKGWPEDRPLPQEAIESAEKIISGWMELGVIENSVWQLVINSVVSNLGEGVAMGDSWYPDDQCEEAVASLSGSPIEKEAAIIALQTAIDSGLGMTIGENGEFEEREDSMINCSAGTVHHFLSAVWEDFGEEILMQLGINEVEAVAAWQQQLERKAPFGKFLRGLESKREEVGLLKLFPWGENELGGICGDIHDLVLLSHKKGLGRGHAKATKMRGDIAKQALGWAWLNAHGKGAGQEWHFEQDARDRGSGWSMAIAELWDVSCSLVSGEETASKEDYIIAMKGLASVCGELQEFS